MCATQADVCCGRSTTQGRQAGRHRYKHTCTAPATLRGDTTAMPPVGGTCCRSRFFSWYLSAQAHAPAKHCPCRHSSAAPFTRICPLSWLTSDASSCTDCNTRLHPSSVRSKAHLSPAHLISLCGFRTCIQDCAFVLACRQVSRHLLCILFLKQLVARM